MSLLGAVLRTKPADLPAVLQRLQSLPGATVGANPGDGRLVLVVEDAEVDAASALAAITAWPEALNVSLVYEYSGPDDPPAEGAVDDYRAWRGSLARRAA